jgi:hypothetical protein
MNRVCLYVGGFIIGIVALAYTVITTVSNTVPPASDLRAVYEKAE